MSSLERRVAGKRLKRIDGIGKVTGKHVYAADFALRGTAADRVTTESGRCACPAHSSTSAPVLMTCTSTRPSASKTPMATGASTA